MTTTPMLIAKPRQLTPAGPGFYLLLPVMSEDDMQMGFEQHPIVSWCHYDDCEFCYPYPVTMLGIQQSPFCAVLDPDGRVLAGDMQYKCISDWLEWERKREVEKARKLASKRLRNGAGNDE